MSHIKYLDALELLLKGPVDINLIEKSTRSKLLNLNLASKKIAYESSIEIPKNAPQWASKFKFTRKRYGISETNTSKTMLKITNKGIRYYKYYSRKMKEPKEDEND